MRIWKFYAFLAPLAILLMAFVSASTVDSSRASAQSPVQKPNIVVFNLDDMSNYDYQTIAAMRRATGDKGAFFENATVTTALCCPSRVSTLTGQYIHNHRVKRHVGTGADGTPEGYPRYKKYGLDKRNVAVWLQDSGYATAAVGKLMNGYHAGSDGIDPGWDEWFVANSPGVSFALNENGVVKRYQDRSSNWEDILGSKSVGVINRWAGKKPLFLYHNPHAPHSPNLWPKRYDDKFSRTPLPNIGAVNEKNVSDKPRYIRNLPRMSRGQVRGLAVKNRERLRSELSVVDQVYRIEAALRKKGQLNNTIFFFTSDNGFHLGSHRLPPGKQTPYVTDHGVPLAVWGKGVTSGVRKHLVTNVDFAPTWLDIAGVPKAGKKLDGKSFLPAIESAGSPANRWRKYALNEGFFGSDVRNAIVPPTYSAVRTQNTVLVRYSTGEQEFYNLKKDPAQARNRIDLMDRSQRRRLDTKRGELFRCSEAACRTAGR